MHLKNVFGITNTIISFFHLPLAFFSIIIFEVRRYGSKYLLTTSPFRYNSLSLSTDQQRKMWRESLKSYLNMLEKSLLGKKQFIFDLYILA